MATSFSVAYNFTANNKHLMRAISEIEKAFEQIKNKSSSVNSSISNMGNNLGNSMNNMGKQINNMGNKLTNFGKTASLYISAPATLASGLSLRAYAEMEQAENKFKAFFGESAAVSISFVKQYAKDSAYGFQEVSEMMNTFKRQQESIGLTDYGITAATKGVGDVFLANAKTADERGRAMYALQQVGMFGHLRAGELIQFSNANIPIMQILGRQSKKTQKELVEMMGRGEISMRMVLEMLLKESKDPITKELLELRRKSLLGQWDSFKENLTFFQAEFGKVISTTFKLPELLESMASKIGNLTEKLKAMPQWGKTILSVVTSVLVVFGPLIVGIGLATRAFGFLLSGAGSSFALLKSIGSFIFGMPMLFLNSAISIVKFARAITIAKIATTSLTIAQRILNFVMGQNIYVRILMIIGAIMAASIGTEKLMKIATTSIKVLTTTIDILFGAISGIVELIKFAFDGAMELVKILKIILDFSPKEFSVKSIKESAFDVIGKIALETMPKEAISSEMVNANINNKAEREMSSINANIKIFNDTQISGDKKTTNARVDADANAPIKAVLGTLRNQVAFVGA